MDRADLNIPPAGWGAVSDFRVPEGTEEAVRRAELLVDVQSEVIDEYNESMLGKTVEVLCEGFDTEAQSYAGRSGAESPDIDGKIYFESEKELMAGEFVMVRLTGVMDGELTGEAV